MACVASLLYLEIAVSFVVSNSRVEMGKRAVDGGGKSVLDPELGQKCC